MLDLSRELHRDEKLVRRGYYTMQDAVAAWPEFNYFTAGYGPSALPHDSPRFQEALQAVKTWPKRACWNSWIAPHNIEGFFLNVGDMLVKAGDPASRGHVRQRPADSRLRELAVPGGAGGPDRRLTRESAVA